MLTVYSKKGCAPCAAAKQWLESNNIGFKEIDVMNDKDAKILLFENGFRTVPQFFLHGKPIVQNGWTDLQKMNPDELLLQVSQG
jgi:glutaredoxin